LVGGLFCDLQYVFDCLNHEILLSKMRFYGILGVINKLIKFIRYISKSFSLIHDALFFRLYINDLSKITSDTSNPVLFTDDTSIVITNSSPWGI
jgi:hypothetical protein